MRDFVIWLKIIPSKNETVLLYVTQQLEDLAVVEYTDCLTTNMWRYLRDNFKVITASLRCIRAFLNGSF